MAICELTGKRPQVKRLVSHSNIKTKTKANPNVQHKRFFSPTLKKMIRLYASTAAIKSMDHMGGFDRYLLSLNEDALSPRALKVRQALSAKKANEAKIAVKGA